MVSNDSSQHRHTGLHVLTVENAPAMGIELPHDRTSYLESQREWYCGGRPHDWHPSLDLLYQFQRGKRPLRSDSVGPLRWRGNVVLNNRNE